jgi:Flp pilus assembly pilin Flp
MSRFVKTMTAVLQTEGGQDLLEYAMLAALIAVVATGAVTTLGNTIDTALWQVIAASSF